MVCGSVPGSVVVVDDVVVGGSDVVAENRGAEVVPRGWVRAWARGCERFEGRVR